MRTRLGAALLLLASCAPAPARAGEAVRLRVAVTFPGSLASGPLDGRLLLFLSTDPSAEPRFQVRDTDVAGSQQVFGIDVDGWKPGEEAVFDGSVLGYPAESLAGVKAGTYRVQALLHRYETFHRADGHVVKLPMDRGEGQQWSRAPGNLLSAPRVVAIDPSRDEVVRVELETAIPPIPPPKDTKYVRHVRIQSERLTRFWGRPMHVGAVVLLPHGFDEHPGARYPLAVFHGHFPRTFDDFREEPPDPNLPCERSERFRLDCYNRIQQEQAHQLFRDWTAPGFPRFLVVQVQHANPYYDDSYAVNSENLGPYGDALQYELLPFVEKTFRALGQGWARFTYGGSTGGWEALAVQTLYPDEYNGCWAACPDPVDFRAYVTTNLYEDANAYYAEGPFGRVARPAFRNWLGHVAATLEQSNRAELVLGTHSRSGGQFDIWEAVYSPVGEDGYPRRIFDKRTGVVDRAVAERWREGYDLGHILKRDWSKGLGKKVEGKIHIYVGDMDNYYLNDAVYLVEEFLKTTRDPFYGGEVDYGDRAEHCWNGDHARPNAYSRLRYIQMFAPRMVERMEKTAPPGADLTSWRY
ncbi:MAG TPA: alpha/beta hydrolase-fold protein [Vicinamibacteria bacterium]|nr:alpha/beta hydrolase-fold protein [Vicinamibacteria bacterium]